MIPEIIHSFNAYKNGKKLIGITGDVTLPNFDAMTATISGAGILGEYNSAVIGQFSSMSMDIPFRVVNEDAVSALNVSEALDITLRGSEQVLNEGTGKLSYSGIRVVTRGRSTAFKPGKMKNGEMMDAAVTCEVTYIMIEIDKKQVIELDKLNYVYKVNGVDLLEKVRSQC